MAETLPCIGHRERKLKPFLDFRIMEGSSVMGKTSSKSRLSATDVVVSDVETAVVAMTVGADAYDDNLGAVLDVVGDTLVGVSDTANQGETEADLPALADIRVPDGWATVEGGIVSEPVSEGSEFTIARADGEEIAPVAAPVSGDLIMQIHAAMPAAVVMQFAQPLADKHMAIITLRDAVTFAVVATIIPGMNKRSRGSAARVNDGDAVARVVSRPEGPLSRIRACGEWHDHEVPASNETILNIKHKIEDAAAADDLDALALLNRKTVGTYYNQAREYRLWHIAAVTKRLEERAARYAAEQAAMDAEFGFDRPGVLLQAA